MKSNSFIEIKYDAFIDNDGVEDFQEIESFKSEIKDSYTASVKANGVGRGGGVYELAVHFISDLDLATYLKLAGLYLGKVAIDKTVDKIADETIEKMLFVPFRNAYKKLKQKNEILDCYSFQIELEDISVFVYKTYDNSLMFNLDKIIEELGNQLEYIKTVERDQDTSFKTTEIHIPAVSDNFEGENLFRTPTDIMVIEKSLTNKDYFKYWGIKYFHNQLSTVYDIRNKSFIQDNNFYTEQDFNMCY